MSDKNLVIVESPAKAKTIEKYLGKEFTVKSSFGHIRDLSKKKLGIDLENNYQPNYEISPDKKKVVSELKKLSKNAPKVWLASDEDREGEAIAWHLFETLELDIQKTKRIVFHEITKDAILNAVKNPREIDLKLVNAQQARRILDRLVGFELSPILWKKVKPSLSAGRVQSVSVRLIAEREREINSFVPTSWFKVSGEFTFKSEDGKTQTLKADLNSRFDSEKEAHDFLEKCRVANFTIGQIDKKPSKKSPAPPFTTSTLQQEASRKLGFSVARTMLLAQKLYESGKITYMRTDSVNLSNLALNTTRKVITEEYGEKYSKTRKFKTSSKGAQEAHEAIRPTFVDQKVASSNKQEQRLYELIRKRTLASQMSEALLEKTNIYIHLNNTNEKFVASGEVILFDGFLKVYQESLDDNNNGSSGPTEGLLPKVNMGQNLQSKQVEATQRFSQKPPRYTEASLVKKLEELGIGRPSTYAPTISTIQNRGYVTRNDKDGQSREIILLTIKTNEIHRQLRKENFGSEKAKLFPTDIGLVVTDFLMDNFSQIMDYNFTARVEKEFDEIAEGQMEWNKMIDQFYKPFHATVEKTESTAGVGNGQRILGKDPKTGFTVLVRIGRYGPLAQIGLKEEVEKPTFAPLRPEQSIETINLEEALNLFSLPRDLGLFEDKKVIVSNGRFGPYIRHDGKFASLKKGIDDPYTIEYDRAIELILAKREADKNKFIKSFEENTDVQILNGRWGPYISYKKKNFKIPKGTVAEDLDLNACMEIIQNAEKIKKKGKK